MKKISEMRVNAVVVAVMLCAFGTLFILRPQLSVNTIGNMIAIGLGVLSLTHLVRFVLQLRKPNEIENALSVGVSIGVCALFLATKQDMMHNMIPIILAILVVFDGAGKLQNSIFLAKNHDTNWWLVLIMGLVNTVLGVVLLWNPVFSSSEDLIIALGIALLFSGVTDLVTLIMITRVMKKSDNTEIVAKENENE